MDESRKGAFRLTMIKNPSNKIMLAEEMTLRDLKTGEAEREFVLSTSGFLWAHGDRLTGRHAGRANVFFADGHSETVKRAFGDQTENTDPLK